MLSVKKGLVLRALPLAGMAAFAVAASGCKQTPSPVTFSVSVPQAGWVAFQANLTQHYNFGLSGTYSLPKNLGTVSLTAETPTAGLGFGFNLDTQSFLPSSWVGFDETTTLPTGATFPAWMTTAVVDFKPGFSTDGIEYHLYIGDHGQDYVGAAGVIPAINGHFPNVNVGYTFYDSKGHVIVGLQFFGPKTDASGAVVTPGGVFVGTNVTPLLPASATSLAIDSALERSILEDRPLAIRGQSVKGNLSLSGPDAKHYRSKHALRGLMEKYLDALRHPL